MFLNILNETHRYWMKERKNYVLKCVTILQHSVFFSWSYYRTMVASITVRLV